MPMHDDDADGNNDDGQSMIVLGSLVDKPSKPKNELLSQHSTTEQQQQLCWMQASHVFSIAEISFAGISITKVISKFMSNFLKR